jgi:hypothetical protein
MAGHAAARLTRPGQDHPTLGALPYRCQLLATQRRRVLRARAREYLAALGADPAGVLLAGVDDPHDFTVMAFCFCPVCVSWKLPP